MEKPAGVTAESGTIGSSQVSVKASTQQFAMSRWKLVRACSSSILLSKDCTFASRMLGSGGFQYLVRALHRIPARLPLFFLLRRRIGIHTGGRTKEPQQALR